MSVVYVEEDFEEVWGVPGKFFCPGCNASWEDTLMPPCTTGPCATHGTGTGSLTAEGVQAYLKEHA